MTQAGHQSNAAPFAPENCQRLIVKLGSSLLVEGEGEIREAWLESLIADLAQRHQAGQQIIVVSSGAIALGARRLGLTDGGRASLADAQASASVGQILLSGCFASLFEQHDITTAQMLVTLDDLEDRRRYLNVAGTLNRLLRNGAIPVINENDSVATYEIRFGDNDRLAARIGQASGAGGVILLSDIDGLYDGDPKDEGANIVPVVDEVDDDIRALVSAGSSSGMGSGGMESKLEAAKIASHGGINLAITSGLVDHPLRRFADGGPSTLFRPDEGQTPHKIWLSGRLTVKGRILIDAGAAKALRQGNSLLPAGATGADGDFARGDVVDIVADEEIIARGLAEYGRDEVLAICGKQSEDIRAILGAVLRNVLVHRDHMVML